jgi:DNA polymerase I
MPPIVAIDGHNLLWCAHNGFPARIKDRSNQDITGLFGFFALLRSTLADIGEALDCVVCFDGERGSESRSESLITYKADRSPNSEPIKHLPNIKCGLDAIGIPWLEQRHLEADDLIAALCRRYQVRRITIVSTDRDFYQLIDKNVSVRAPRRGAQVVTEATVLAKYGVAPSQWCDFRAITGDRSDNVPGVPRLGDRRAARLLAEGHSLDDLFKERSARDRFHKMILDNEELLRLNQRTLRLDGLANLPELTLGRIRAPLPLARDVLLMVAV